MFRSEYRLKEKQKDGKTVYVIQGRHFLFWWNLSDPIEDKAIADGVMVLLTYPQKLRDIDKRIAKLDKRINERIGIL